MMYKKILLFLTLGMMASGCGAGVSEICTGAYDSVRTAEQNYSCLLNYRVAYDQLESDVGFVLENSQLFFTQPVNPNIDLTQPVNPNLF